MKGIYHILLPIPVTFMTSYISYKLYNYNINNTLNKDIDSNKTVQNNDTNEITELKNIVVNLKSEVSEIKESLKRLTNK